MNHECNHHTTSADAQRHNRTIPLRGSHVELARKVAESGEETPILYHPSNPKRFLLGLQLTSQLANHRHPKSFILETEDHL